MKKKFYKIVSSSIDVLNLDYDVHGNDDDMLYGVFFLSTQQA